MTRSATVLPQISFCLLCLLSCGCSSWLPEMTPYGAVDSPDQYRSINGLGVHRKMWESAGVRCVTPHKLSPRLETFETIVLVGTDFTPPGLEARQWLNEWLAREPGRTVIYFGRDFNADLYYREKTLEAIPAEKQERAQELLAMRQASELSSQLSALADDVFCGWFQVKVAASPVVHTKFRGEWADDVNALGGTWPTKIQLLPPTRGLKLMLPAWIKKSALAEVEDVDAIEIDLPSDETVYRSEWNPKEYDTIEKWNDAFRELPDVNLLLSSSDGTPLVYSLTDDERFPSSQIIVVANSAPFLNGSLVEPLHQTIGRKIIEECLPGTRTALVAYGSGGLLISETAELAASGLGLEMLTVWPISGITMSAVLMGILFCAALLPILGRPQKLPTRSVSDFGLHVEALGQMLQESRDLGYAQRMIGEYFSKVRSESPPDWLALPASESNEPPPPNPSK